MEHFQMTLAFLLALLTNLATPSLCHVMTRHSKSISATGVAQLKHRFPRDIVLPTSPEDLPIFNKDFSDFTAEFNPLSRFESLCEIMNFLPVRFTF